VARCEGGKVNGACRGEIEGKSRIFGIRFAFRKGGPSDRAGGKKETQTIAAGRVAHFSARSGSSQGDAAAEKGRQKAAGAKKSYYIGGERYCLQSGLRALDVQGGGKRGKVRSSRGTSGESSRSMGGLRRGRGKAGGSRKGGGGDPQSRCTWGKAHGKGRSWKGLEIHLNKRESGTVATLSGDGKKASKTGGGKGVYFRKRERGEAN